MKHCTDCRFFLPKADSTPEYGLCTRDKARSPQSSDKFIKWLVVGMGDAPPDEICWTYACTMRAFVCGVDAKLFEPKANVPDIGTDIEAAAQRRRDHDFAAKGQQ